MGKLRIWLLVPMLLLLVGCGEDGEDRLQEALAFRSALQGAGGCSFLGEITADFGEYVYTFSVSCQVDATGTLTFQVTAPETISGITGSVSADGGALTFDDVALAFPTLAEGRVGPVTAPYLAAESWRTGYISAVGADEKGLRLTVDTSYEADPLVVDTWLDAEKGVPISSEVCYNGQRLLSISISEFQYNNTVE